MFPESFTEKERKILADCSSRISAALRFDVSQALTKERVEAMDAKERQVANALLSKETLKKSESNGDSHADVSYRPGPFGLLPSGISRVGGFSTHLSLN